MLAWSFCCTILIAFANGGLRVSFNILRWPQLLFRAKDSHWSPSCDTKILIRIKIQWSNSGVDLVVLLYDSHSCANGCLELIVQVTRRLKSCHSELRVLYCICGTESSWPKASRYHCIPYVMGGGWELFIHIRGDRNRGTHSNLTYLT